MAQPVIERLAPPAAGLMTLLGMEPNPASAAISGFALDTQFSRVNRAFRQHNLHGMQGELREIRMTGEASVRMLREVGESLPQNVRSVEELAQEIKTKLVSSPMLNQEEFEATKDTLQRIWWRCEELRSSLSSDEAARTGPLWQKALHEFNQQLTSAEQEHLLNQPNRVRTLNLNLNLASSDLRVLCARIGLMHRCNQVIESRRLDPVNHREDAARCFNALHASQRAAAVAYAAGDAAYALHQTKMQQDELRTSFTLERFLDLENRIVDFESSERVRNLNLLWHQLVFSHNLNLGANPPRTAYEESLWMRDRANAQALAQCVTGTLSVVTLSAVPDEIETLQGMRNLRIFGGDNGNERLRILNAKIASLPLQGLWLIGQDFGEIPQVLETLSPLRQLYIQDNQQVINSFPEGVARQQFGGFAYLALEAGNEIFGGLRLPGGVRHFAWLPRGFTEIPFFLWFRENFTLPYIPVFSAYSPFFSSMMHTLIERPVQCLGLDSLLMNLFAYLGMPRYFTANNFLTFISLFVLTFPLWIIPIGLFLLNVPIFLFNLFVNKAVEPLVSFVRENLLGYSPMVRI
jgi:hypothetical protein